MNLTEFLLARIDEDEARAAKFKANWLAADMPEDHLVHDLGVYPSTEYTEIGLGLGRFLAECEAKRRIIERCRPFVAVVWRESDRLLASAFDKTHMPTVAHSDLIWPDERSEETLRALALPYADHPDYDEAWRP